jgi:hypothetical protein
MPKHYCKFTEYTCFCRGHNGFEDYYMVCSPGTFISVANKGSLGIEVHLETTEHAKIFEV